ncbi:MAG: sensor histidine kinase, partial [Gemmatimonadales bacterium]
ALVFLALRVLTRRFPPFEAPRTLRIFSYAGALILLSAFKTTFQWVSRTAVYAAAAAGPYSYGVISARYPMEFSNDLVIMMVMIAGLWGWDRLEAARARELRAVQLEGRLARSQLENLRLQLQPHFLFNALNTISAAVYDDPAAADRMVTQLAELLRASLRHAEHANVPLAEEIEVLRVYVSLLAARFGERLDVRWDVDPAAERALVPPFLLQPLVENAVRHGGLSRTGQGRIDIAAHCVNSRLRLSVSDDGPGAPAGRPWGTGLHATADRLKLLHGAAQTFSAANGPAGGFVACAELPFDPAS